MFAARFPVLLGLLCAAALSATTACADDPAPSVAAEDAPSPSEVSVEDLPPVVQRIATGRHAPATDLIEVWVCRVPLDTTDPIYGGLLLRLPLTPDDLVARAADRLRAYFLRLSGGAYEVVLRPGGTVDLAADEPSGQCAERALSASSAEADAVLVVADAEHAATASGGFGSAGTWPSCATAGPGSCAARTTRRVAYVGASDFHPDWGPVPALDLVQHEIGHLLDLPHSGGEDGAEDEGEDEGEDGAVDEAGYSSALDVMSNSAAPRDVDPARRDGPGTLAINRLALGWLPLDAVVVAAAGETGERTEWQLAPAASTVTGNGSVDDRTRLVVLPVDEHRALTVELLVAEGDDAHLPGDGVAVHLVDDSAGAGALRRQRTLGSPSPHTDLLTTGEQLEVFGWRIEVLDLRDGRVHLAVTGTQR